MYLQLLHTMITRAAISDTCLDRCKTCPHLYSTAWIVHPEQKFISITYNLS